MKGTLIGAGSVLLILLFYIALRPERAQHRTAEVRTDKIQVWSSYEGYIEARTVRNIMSRLGGTATIIEMAVEGAQVKAGDLLVRLDSTQFDRDLVRLERDVALAKADLDGALNARLPLEIRDLEMRILQARTDLATEEQFLEDSRQLKADGLVAEMEVRQQEQKVDSLRLQVKNLEEQLRLTQEHLHPSVIERARSTLKSAEQELELVRQQIQNCTITAPSDGIVVYKPTNVGGEYRTVRVGDSIFRNQPFMTLPDMSDLVVHIDVPESELSLVRTGLPVVVQPMAYPDLSLRGAIESIGSMAQTKNDRPGWQKYFHVVIGLDDIDPRLRTGMSVVSRILTHEQTDAVVVARAGVTWDQEQSYCSVVRRGQVERRAVKLGAADEQRFIVLEGLAPGERVVIE